MKEWRRHCIVLPSFRQNRINLLNQIANGKKEEKKQIEMIQCYCMTTAIDLRMIRFDFSPDQMESRDENQRAHDIRALTRVNTEIESIVK